jgi:hypothetical protein
VEFYHGTAIDLRGPATLVVVSEHAAELKAGAVSVVTAGEFYLQTPFAEIANGDRYQANVDEDGLSLQVIAGQVELRMSQTQLVQAGESRRVNADGQVQTTEPAASSVSLAETRQLRLAAREAAERQWAADLDTLLLYSMHDLPADAREIPNRAQGKVASSGTAVGSHAGTGRWPDMRAMAFTGPADRIRFHAEGAYPALTVAGWFLVSDFPNIYSSLVMTDGFEPGEFHWQLADDGHLHLCTQGDDSRRGTIYASAYNLNITDLDRWIHLAFTFDLAAGRLRHYVDGELVDEEALRDPLALQIGDAEIGNWSPRGTDSDKPFRGFRGKIDQLLIVARELDASEMRALYKAGDSD